MDNNGKIIAISISERKGIPKTNVDSAVLIREHGIQGDAHAGKWHRQISLLASESIDKIKAKGLNVSPGNFAENITTEGFDLLSLEIGDKIKAGETTLEITQIGKECHSRCAIFNITGDCVMPREGYFARVLEGGNLQINDKINKL